MTSFTTILCHIATKKCNKNVAVCKKAAAFQTGCDRFIETKRFMGDSSVCHAKRCKKGEYVFIVTFINDAQKIVERKNKKFYVKSRQI